jgi:hypothetical protein
MSGMLDDCFSKLNIKESSSKMYKKNLQFLNDNKPIANTTFLKDSVKIIKKISHLKPNTQRNYIISVVSFLKCQDQTKPIKRLFDEYTKIMNDYNEKLKTSNNKTLAESENWISKEEIDKRYLDLKTDVEGFTKKTKLTESEYNKLLQLVVFSLYYLIPPRRNADYQLMRFDKKDGYNQIDLKNKKFIFNNYKTQKTYKSQEIDIPNDLLEVIKLYMKYIPKDSEYFLLRYNGQNLKLVNDITRILNSIFDKKIGSSMLRKMYHTNKYGNVIQDLEEDAKKMGHSVEVVKSHFLKK